MALVVGLSSIAFSARASGFDHNHAAFTKILEQYRSASGLINYGKLKKDSEASAGHPINLYIQNLFQVRLADYNGWSEPQKKAFLINAYNVLTIKLILNHYPVRSIKKIGGFFTKPWSIKFFKLLDGKIESLDPIEHEWLRPKFKDYRIHAAVNCASISCPVLRFEAYRADSLDAQLEDQMKIWLEDTTRNNLSPINNAVSISKIFDWYKVDFESWGGGVRAVLTKHSGKALGNIEHLKFLDYNWELNEVK